MTPKPVGYFLAPLLAFWLSDCVWAGGIHAGKEPIRCRMDRMGHWHNSHSGCRIFSFQILHKQEWRSAAC